MPPSPKRWTDRDREHVLEELKAILSDPAIRTNDAESTVATKHGISRSTLRRWQQEADRRSKERATADKLEIENAELRRKLQTSKAKAVASGVVTLLVGAYLGIVFQNPSLSDGLTPWARDLDAELTLIDSSTQAAIIPTKVYDAELGPALMRWTEKTPLALPEGKSLYRYGPWLGDLQFTVRLKNKGSAQIQVDAIELTDLETTSAADGVYLRFVPQGGPVEIPKLAAYPESSNTHFYEVKSRRTPPLDVEPWFETENIELGGHESYDFKGGVFAFSNTSRFRLVIKYTYEGHSEQKLLQDGDQPFWVTAPRCSEGKTLRYEKYFNLAPTQLTASDPSRLDGPGAGC